MTERGTLLAGRYQLDQVIGRGGMAEVWRAHDTRLGRDVAVKRLRLDLASDPTFQARFRREAQSAAGLNHPNIVSVYDTGEELDPASDVEVPYIVMELVEGVTLRDVLRDGRRVVPARALEFTSGVLEALYYSHRAGIIHRDIKPANVMLTPQGQVKVMDFGIARAVADTSATMTQTAAVIGTAQYLSPEQARGEKVDNRSDIYAVGCLLYELLVSQPPFRGDSPVSVAYQHVREMPVPPSQLDPEVTPAMDAITLKALAKDPADRYQDAREMRDDIQRALAGQPVAAMADTGAPTEVLDATTVRAAVPATGATTVVSPAPPVPAVPVVTTDEVLDDAEEGRSKGLMIALSVLAALLLAGLIWLAYTLMNNDGTASPSPSPTASVSTSPSESAVQMVAVPRVSGLSEAAAKNQLLDDGFEVGDSVHVNDPDVAKGYVVSSNPEGGTQAPKGSPVVLTVSDGPGQVTVPSGLVGMTQAVAEAALKAVGLTANTESVTGTADNAGKVVAASPKPGESVNAGSAVTLQVSTGAEMVQVPGDLVGMAEADAVAAIEGAGLVAAIEDITGTADDAGTVLKATPDEGEVAKGTTVTIQVSKGADDITVPTDLVGMTEKQARDALAKAGFTGTITTTPADAKTEPIDAKAGTVLSVDPGAGSTVAPDGTVTLVLAMGQSVVPDVTGMTAARAEQTLADAGFTKVKVEEVTGTQNPSQVVFEQDPLADSVVDRSTEIILKVAK